MRHLPSESGLYVGGLQHVVNTYHVPHRSVQRCHVRHTFIPSGGFRRVVLRRCCFTVRVAIITPLAFTTLRCTVKWKAASLSESTRVRRFAQLPILSTFRKPRRVCTGYMKRMTGANPGKCGITRTLRPSRLPKLGITRRRACLLHLFRRES